METIGTFLRQQRGRAGKSLDEISGAIKVRASLLQDLENDRLDRLPGGVFVRGYVKAYLNMLHADAQRGLELLDAAIATPGGELAPLVGLETAEPRERRFKLSHALVLAAALATMMAAYFISADQVRPVASISAGETTDADSGTSRTFSPLNP